LAGHGGEAPAGQAVLQIAATIVLARLLTPASRSWRCAGGSAPSSPCSARRAA